MTSLVTFSHCQHKQDLCPLILPHFALLSPFQHLTGVPVTQNSIDPDNLAANQAHLRILETTDLHLHVMPYDYFTDSDLPGSGLAQAGDAIDRLRAASGLSLLLDNGDFLQGTPLSDWIAEDSGFGPGDLHPMIGAMNALGYDGATLGNHDFNYGMAFLSSALAQARFPVVSANVTTAQGDTPAQDSTLVPAWTILNRTATTGDGGRHPIRIGIIGFAPPQTRDWERLSVGTAIDTRDIVAAARAHVPRLRAAGADIVVALGHTGIGEDAHTHRMENAAVPLAAVDGIDAVLAGHTHMHFPGPDFTASTGIDPAAGTLHGKPAVMAGSHGSHIGVIDMLLERQGTGWTVQQHAARLQPVSRTQASHGAVAASVKSAHDTVIGLMRQQIGTTSAPLHSHLSLVGHSTALGVLACAMGQQARRRLAGTDYAEWPMAMAVAPSRSGGQTGPCNYVDIPAGPLARRHAAELYQYPNKLCVLAFTGAEIRDWLEWSARMFRPLRPGGQDQPLLDPGVPGYNFDSLYGLRYTIDPSQPAATGARSGDGRRISGLALANGQPLRPTDPILLVTNTYRTCGGGGYGDLSPDRIVYTCKKGLREVVLQHMQSGPIHPDPAPAWTFAPLPGTTAWFDSSPDALAHLPADGSLRITAQGLQPGGFMRYRLHL